jgi:uncharacterized membrane protein
LAGTALGGLSSTLVNNTLFLFGRISTRGWGIHDFNIIDATTNKTLLTLHTHSEITYSAEENAFYIGGQTLTGDSGIFNIYTGELAHNVPKDINLHVLLDFEKD